MLQESIDIEIKSPVSDECHTYSKPLGNTREIPNRLDREFCNGQFSQIVETYLLVRHNATITDTLFKFGQFHMLDCNFEISIAFCDGIYQALMHSEMKESP